MDVLGAIQWLQEAWKEVTNLTINNCFEKCIIKGDNKLMEVKEDNDLKFEALLKEFTTDRSAAEYSNFNKNVPASEPMINHFQIHWQKQVRENSINAIQNPDIASDQAKEISNDDWGNDKNDHLEQESMGFKEIITMLDKMKRCPVFDDESQDMLSIITKRIEDLQLKNREQSSIRAYFNKSMKIFLSQFFVKEYLYMYKYLLSDLQST